MKALLLLSILLGSGTAFAEGASAGTGGATAGGAAATGQNHSNQASKNFDKKGQENQKRGNRAKADMYKRMSDMSKAQAKAAQNSKLANLDRDAKIRQGDGKSGQPQKGNRQVSHSDAPRDGHDHGGGDGHDHGDGGHDHGGHDHGDSGAEAALLMGAAAGAAASAMSAAQRASSDDEGDDVEPATVKAPASNSSLAVAAQPAESAPLLVPEPATRAATPSAPAIPNEQIVNIAVAMTAKPAPAPVEAAALQSSDASVRVLASAPAAAAVEAPRGTKAVAVETKAAPAPGASGSTTIAPPVVTARDPFPLLAKTKPKAAAGTPFRSSVVAIAAARAGLTSDTSHSVQSASAFSLETAPPETAMNRNEELVAFRARARSVDDDDDSPANIFEYVKHTVARIRVDRRFAPTPGPNKRLTAR